MPVNISELQKFADTFGPAIEAIPAVISAVNQQQDLDRHIEQKKYELQEIMKSVDNAKTQADGLIAIAQDECESLKIQAQNEVNAIKEAGCKAKKAAEDQKAKIEAQLVAAAGKVTDAETKAAAAEEAMRSKLAALDEAHNARVLALTAEVEALEDRKAKAEKALLALRAKLEV
jgi:chromosome segregation ATPase